MDERVNLFVKKLDSSVTLPQKQYKTDAGFDLFANEKVVIKPYSKKQIFLDFSMRLPANRFGHILSRSSLAMNGINVLGGIIDEGYIGNVSVILHNTTKDNFYIEKGNRIAQLIIQKYYANVDVIETENLGAPTERGDNGFGSTGK